MIDASDLLPPSCARELQIAVMGCMHALGGEAMFCDEDDDFEPGTVRLARIGDLVLVERLGDRAKGKPRRFTAYQVDPGEPGVPFRLDPDAALFVLSEAGFYTPPDWELTLLHDPHEWFNETLIALHVALEAWLRLAC